eukprot:4452916-Karenia_brevis.AAC.1
MALEAALGKDLKEVQQALIAAKAELAKIATTTVATIPHGSLQDTLEAAVGSQLSASAGVLGKLQVHHVLDGWVGKGWRRRPSINEILVLNEKSGSMHSLRPPLIGKESEDLTEFM